MTSTGDPFNNGACAHKLGHVLASVAAYTKERPAPCFDRRHGCRHIAAPILNVSATGAVFRAHSPRCACSSAWQALGVLHPSHCSTQTEHFRRQSCFLVLCMHAVFRPERRGFSSRHAQQLVALHRGLTTVGVAHRDVCPRHLLCNRDGQQLLVIDWGFARPTAQPWRDGQRLSQSRKFFACCCACDAHRIAFRQPPLLSTASFYCPTAYKQTPHHRETALFSHVRPRGRPSSRVCFRTSDFRVRLLPAGRRGGRRSRG